MKGLLVDRVMDYVGFVEARHAVWLARQAGDPQPWTDDPIVAQRKFTNVFRVLDFGSQYVGQKLLWVPGLSDRDRLFRAFLYRHTGRPEPWDFFEMMQGRFPLVSDLHQLGETWGEYRGEPRHVTRGSVKNTSTASIAFANPIFTGAYLVFPQSQVPGTDKMDSILDLAARLFTPGSPEDIVPRFLAAETQRERFTVLRNNKGVGDFMSMQVLTDWGYTTEDREDDFIVPGPGAIKGAAALAPGEKAVAVVRWAHQLLQGLDLSITLPDGRRRSASLMDAQNTLCEFSKYVRFMEKPVSGSLYKPTHPGEQPAPWIPPLW